MKDFRTCVLNELSEGTVVEKQKGNLEILKLTFKALDRNSRFFERVVSHTTRTAI